MNLEIKNIIRDWFVPGEEKGYGAISFFLTSKPKSRILLTEDKEYEKTFNFHIEWGEELTELELEVLVRGVLEFLPFDWNLTTCGECGEQKLRLYRKFFSELTDTGCVRIVRDERDGHSVYLKILKKKKK